MDAFKKALLGPLTLHKRESLTHETEAEKQLILFLSRTRDIEWEEAKALYQRVMQHRGEPTVAEFTFYQRENMEDKAPRKTSVRNFLKQVEAENLVLTPSFSTYLPATEVQSWVGAFVAENMERRKQLRVEAYRAKAENDTVTYRRKNVGQVLTKLDNNILSGTAISRGSILFNPSNHSSLTSMTRCITSTCNANSERNLAGRLNFFKVDIAIGYYTAILSNLDQNGNRAKWEALPRAIPGLVIPTAKQLLAEVRRNTDIYFPWTERAEKLVWGFIKGLSDLELTACYYAGSLYNFKTLNPEIMREFVSIAKVKIEATEVIPDVVDKIYATNSELRLLTHYRFYNELRGIGVEYATFDPLLVSSMYLTVLEYEKHFTKYEALLKTVVLTEVQPPTIYDFKEAIRYSIIMSDTDSGVHFLEKWVEWYSGNSDINVLNITVANLLVTVGSLTLQWLLRGVMVNMNVAESEIERQRLNLKPEFCMIIFNLMSVSKHYAAGLYVENGNVFDELEIEIKGGTLKNSAIPEEIRSLNNFITRGIMEDLIRDGKISLVKFVTLAAKMELKIFLSIHEGKAEYLRTIGIDAADSYKDKDPSKNRYHHCLFWNDVFGDALNYHAATPYRAVKVPVALKGKKRISEWVEDMDEPYKSKMLKWLKRFNKTTLTTLYIPMEYSNSYGLPDAIQSVIDSKRLVMDLCRMLYISIETLAFYRKEDSTVLETLGHTLDYATLKRLGEQQDIGGFDVGWTDETISEAMDSIVIPEGPSAPW